MIRPITAEEHSESLEEIKKVLKALPEPQNDDSDLALIVYIDDVLTAIPYGELKNYTINKDGEIIKIKE